MQMAPKAPVYVYELVLAWLALKSIQGKRSKAIVKGKEKGKCLIMKWK